MKGRAGRIVAEALERGAAHHRAGRWADAARAYAEVLAAEPDHLDALALIAGVLLRLDRPGPALQAADRALALDPGHAVAALTRGRALVALGRPAEAIAAFDVALAARPGFPEASLGRARACVAAGRPAEALPALRVAAERDPRARWDLGVAELEAGDPTAAAASWQLALAAGVGDPVALGRLLLRTAPPDAAGIPAIRRAAELGVPGAWATLADTVLRFPDAADRDTLLALLARDDIDAQRIEPAVRRRLGPDLEIGRAHV